MSERYIVIPKWSELQHYKKQTRPPWIKAYTKLLHDDRYLSLTGRQRAILHGLWMLYAMSGRKVPLKPAAISRQLGMDGSWRDAGGLEHGSSPVRMRDLDVLNHAGFIRFRSRPALDEVSSRREEKRIERSKGLTEANYVANGLRPETSIPEDLTRSLP